MARSTPPAIAALMSPAAIGVDRAHMHPFEKLIGSWSLVITDLRNGQVVKRYPGSWSFGWGLGGKAILDVWNVRGRSPGLTVRFFDKKIDAWRSTWLVPGSGSVVPFIGRFVKNEIVLTQTGTPGEIDHWIFSEITPSHFKWRSETSTDGARSWRIDQTMFATRTTQASRHPGPAPQNCP